jgi:hypothetical protein
LAGLCAVSGVGSLRLASEAAGFAGCRVDADDRGNAKQLTMSTSRPLRAVEMRPPSERRLIEPVYSGLSLNSAPLVRGFRDSDMIGPVKVGEATGVWGNEGVVTYVP